MLDLIRLSRNRPFPPGGKEIFRHIGLLTGMGPNTEVLDVACGSGRALEYLADEFGVHGGGVDSDADAIAEGDARLKGRGFGDRVLIQRAPHDQLPYRDAIFDVAIGQIGLASCSEPAAALRELARVTRPGGSIVLVQLAWKAPLPPARRHLMAEYLGAQPLMVVEWKRLLREVGVERIHTEDWSDEETAFRSRIVKPFPDFSEQFSWPEKLAIFSRARRRWGWRGVWEAIRRDRAVHAFLSHERILGLDLLKGVKGASSTTSSASPTVDRLTPEDVPGRVVEISPAAIGSHRSSPLRTPPSPDPPEKRERRQIEGLPLFDGEPESSGTE